MPKRSDSRTWQYGLMALGVVAAVAVVVFALFTGHAATAATTPSAIRPYCQVRLSLRFGTAAAYRSNLE